jgi:hypothetical protein
MKCAEIFICYVPIGNGMTLAYLHPQGPLAGIAAEGGSKTTQNTKEDEEEL